MALLIVLIVCKLGVGVAPLSRFYPVAATGTTSRRSRFSCSKSPGVIWMICQRLDTSTSTASIKDKPDGSPAIGPITLVRRRTSSINRCGGLLVRTRHRHSADRNASRHTNRPGTRPCTATTTRMIPHFSTTLTHPKTSTHPALGTLSLDQNHPIRRFLTRTRRCCPPVNPASRRSAA